LQQGLVHLIPSPHSVRRWLEWPTYLPGVRLVVVQELLGHATVTSTQRYAWLANRRVREEYVAGMQKI
jgi:site-specific recombinase XerD